MNTKGALRHIRAMILVSLLSGAAFVANAAPDTVKVMAYNVLYYGNGCQGPNADYHNYLATILKYTDADLVSLEKVSSVKLFLGDEHGVAPHGFADSILKYAFNKAFPGRYAYCTITNEAKANNISILFYDRTKLNFSNIVVTYVNGTDYNTYKLYHTTHNGDSSLLYVTCNHTKSGDEFDDVRQLQVNGVLQSLRHHFSALGNHLFLGDFNARSSDEGFYQLLTANKDSAFRFYDPPFYPDRQLKYPCNWDHDARYATYFTTSTRESASVPNSCGSGGGAKNWYDHIFISRSLADARNDIQYVPNSYRTIGNDGQRFKVSAINSNAHINASAPPAVVNAIYNMSNKYPVMIDLVMSDNLHRPSTEIAHTSTVEKQDVTILKTTPKFISIYFPSELVGQELTIECSDKSGAKVIEKKITLEDANYELKHKLPPGSYKIIFSGRHNLITTASFEIR